MAILRPVKSIAAVALIVFQATVQAKCPDAMLAWFAIGNWSSHIPTSGRLLKYKKDTSFTALEETITARFITKEMTHSGSGRYISVQFGDVINEIPISADYKLIIDDRIEFRISNIYSSQNKRAGCPLESFQVNACRESMVGSISFDKSCGEPVTK